jgi:hypothetical protein
MKRMRSYLWGEFVNQNWSNFNVLFISYLYIFRGVDKKKTKKKCLDCLNLNRIIIYLS